MTTRLYQANSYQREFAATVTHSLEHEGQPAVILDQTCFYPTAGGQLHDTGYLGQQRVLDVVVDKASNEILHLLDKPLSIGLTQGSIDWTRRFEHMQQHTGQHLLSQTFIRLFDLDTISMRIGAKETTIDLETPATPEQALEAEQFVNGIIYENRPITTYQVDETDVEKIPLRRSPKVSGYVRIVEIADFDYSACGGTHCRQTGEVGIIKIVGMERRKAGVRITFKCGHRALTDYAAKHSLIQSLSDQFSTHETELLDAVNRQTTQLKESQQRYQQLEKAHQVYEIQTLVNQAEMVGDVNLIATLLPNKEPSTLKNLASALQAQTKTIVLLGSSIDQKASFVYARSEEINLNVGQVLRESLSKFGGRGGGKADFAQGAGPANSGEAILKDSIDYLKAMLP